MRAMVSEREMRALGINFIFLLRTLVTVHRGNCSFSKLPKSWADDTGEIEASWRRTEHALRATIQFVKSEIGWTTRRWLPSTMALIPVVCSRTQAPRLYAGKMPNLSSGTFWSLVCEAFSGARPRPL